MQSWEWQKTEPKKLFCWVWINTEQETESQLTQLNKVSQLWKLSQRWEKTELVKIVKTKQNWDFKTEITIQTWCQAKFSKKWVKLVQSL